MLEPNKYIEEAIKARKEGCSMKTGTTYFIDIDGTIVDRSTQRPLENAVEIINSLYDAGNTIILTTLRGEDWKEDSRFSVENTMKMLREIRIKYHHILWDIPSPRILINDSGAVAINHEPDTPWILKSEESSPSSTGESE